MGNGKDALTVNQTILTWAQGKLGKKIGRGKCWDLGEAALKNAGAKTSRDLGPVDEDSDYIWGDTIDIKDVQPGDIMQIRDHLVVTKTVTEYTFGDGNSIKVTGEREAVRGHHTAIAATLPDANGVISTYEQHVNGRDVVQTLRLNTRSLNTVTTKGQEKYKNPGTKKMEQADFVRTVKVTVTGTIQAYRPKPKTTK